ncbi:MAG: hypothetical protein JXA90_00545, partial [Planctomycetes bacterium]|nr:hypothetical protein [Planctomycetota bacterium]
AEGLVFIDEGRISPSASAQTTRLAIDAAGRVHCSFYRNTGNGQYEHRVFDIEAGWGESTNLGNTAAPNDVWGSLAADGLGNVHTLFIEDSTDTSPLWRVQYRRWDAVAGWGEAVTFREIAPEQRTGIANNNIFAIACDEPSGKVTILYRDLNRGGPLGIVEKELEDGGFGEFVELEPPTIGPHAYYSPSIRGRLFPASDRTLHGMHMTWQHRPDPEGPPYSLTFAALGGSGGAIFRRGDTDGDSIWNLTDAVFGLSALFLAGSPMPGCLDAADSNDDGLFNLSDAVYTLGALFLGGPMPPAPGPDDCESDPTADDLGCERYESC